MNQGTVSRSHLNQFALDAGENFVRIFQQYALWRLRALPYLFSISMVDSPPSAPEVGRGRANFPIHYLARSFVSILSGIISIIIV